MAPALSLSVLLPLAGLLVVLAGLALRRPVRAPVPVKAPRRARR